MKKRSKKIIYGGLYALIIIICAILLQSFYARSQTNAVIAKVQRSVSEAQVGGQKSVAEAILHHKEQIEFISTNRPIIPFRPQTSYAGGGSGGSDSLWCNLLFYEFDNAVDAADEDGEIHYEGFHGTVYEYQWYILRFLQASGCEF